MKAFEKIIGYTNEKKDLMRIADILKNPEYYNKLGAKSSKGLLLDGRPGLGKTLMANALIEASGRKSFICRKDKSNGDFVNFIKETFDKAMENAPSIVFLDDMDKFANEDDEKRNAEEYVTVQSCIDNAKDKDVFILATTNCKRNLPDSLIRAGRFDRILNIYPPDYKDAIEIIKYYLRGKDIMIDIDPEYIAKLLHRSSCATIETIINEATVIAAFERCEKIQLSHFIEACTKIVFHHDSFELCDEDIDLDNGRSVHSEIAYHEAGHAVVSEILAPGSVTLVAVGKYGGHTTYFDESQDLDKRYKNRNIIINLSGIAAIEQRYGQKGKGAMTDLQNARKSINHQIKNNGLCGFGTVETYETDSNERIKNQEYAADILLDQYYTKAKVLIAENREFLEKVASELAEKKILTMYDIQRIKKTCNIKEVDVE